MSHITAAQLSDHKTEAISFNLKEKISSAKQARDKATKQADENFTKLFEKTPKVRTDFRSF